MVCVFLRKLDSISARRQGKLRVTKKFCSILNKTEWTVNLIFVVPCIMLNSEINPTRIVK